MYDSKITCDTVTSRIIALSWNKFYLHECYQFQAQECHMHNNYGEAVLAINIHTNVQNKENHVRKNLNQRDKDIRLCSS